MPAGVRRIAAPSRPRAQPHVLGEDATATRYRQVAGRCPHRRRPGAYRPGLRLAVEVPVGAEAEVHVPAARRADTTDPGGARQVRTEPGYVVYRAPHGSWEFTARE